MSASSPLSEFVGRHVGPRDADVTQMLGLLGQPSLDALCDAAVPGAIRQTRSLDIEASPSELAVLEELRDLAAKNSVLTSMIGLGYYDTITPGVILRNVVENPAWYTAYTPYQPEISQGRLEALLNFQTMVSDLTAMEVANASMLDEATAADTEVEENGPLDSVANAFVGKLLDFGIAKAAARSVVGAAMNGGFIALSVTVACELVVGTAGS